MPEFDTTGPIAVTVNLAAGDVRVIAGDTPGTTVRVRPGNPSSEQDRSYAEQTVVECADGRLLVKGPKPRGFGVIGPSSKTGVIDVEIVLAAGSSLDADGSILNLTGTGTLGATRVKSGVGDIRLDHVASADLKTGTGAVTVQGVDGDATANTGAGDLRIGPVGGRAQLKTGSGETQIEGAAAGLRARSSNGGVQAGRVGGDVDVASANGAIRIGEVAAGRVTLKTALGDLEIGVPEGLPAYLDMHTSFGNVLSRLDASEAPGAGQQHVEITARTSYGDITIRRP